MSLSFGHNLGESIHFANHAFKSFSSWFILLLLGLFSLTGATIVMIGSLLIIFALFLSVLPFLEEYFTDVLGSYGMTFMDAVPFIADMFNATGIAFTVIGLVVALVFGFFVSGTFVRAARGGEMTLAHPGKLFLEGLSYFVIVLIYMVPYIVACIFIPFGPLDNMAYLILVVFLLQLLLFFFCMMFGLMAVTAYAKGGTFGAGFSLRRIGTSIARFGYLRLLGHTFLIYFILAVIALILVLIPILGWIVLLLISPFVTIVMGRFFGNITESVADRTEELTE